MNILRKSTGLVLVITVLLAVVIFNASSISQILGWDNFSVSLNLKENLLHSLSSWREYRAFGVASDSEYVDVIRIIILSILSLLLPTEYVEYIYTLILFVVGVSSMYLFLKKLFEFELFKSKMQFVELTAGIGALFYGFNLHALETFYFPIAMYTARFAFLPLCLFSVLLLLDSKKVMPKRYLFFCIATLLLSTAYLTATVFITVLLLLILFLPVFFKYSVNKTLVLGIVFILLNSFWLLPFVNYTVQKADDIPKASSFVPVNQALLNKPERNFSFVNISTFYPETLNKNALPFRKLDINEQFPVHKLVNTSWSATVLLSLPVFISMLGVVAFVLQWRQKKLQPSGLTAIAIFIVSLFFLRKNLWPFGYLYELVTTHLPLLAIIFRFSGTKFYPLLLIAEVILFVKGVQLILSFLIRMYDKETSKLWITGVLTCVVLTLLVPLWSQINGNLISPLVRVSLPPAYTELQSWLDKNDPTARVLHVPMDQFSYWRSYSWGYVGSSFLNFLLQNPVIDRTFEPASPELDAFTQSWQNIVTQDAADNSKVIQASALLQKTGTQYVVFDESVSSDITARNLKGWGVFHSKETDELLQLMETSGEIELKQSYKIEGKSVRLYKVKNTEPMFALKESAVQVDPTLENTFIAPALLLESSIQGETSARYYPFRQPQANYSYTAQGLQLQFSTQPNTQIELRVPRSEMISAKVLMERSDSDLTVYLQPEQPFTQEAVASASAVTFENVFNEDQQVQSLERFQNNWHLSSVGETLSNTRLRVDGTVLPVPNLVAADGLVEIGSVLTKRESQIALLKANKQIDVPERAFVATDNPNCYGDKTTGYAQTVTVTTAVDIRTQNGMTCVTAPIWIAEEDEEQPVLFELELNYASESTQNEAKAYIPQTSMKYHAATAQYMQTQPSSLPLSACILEPSTGLCLNQRQWLKSPQTQAVTIQTTQQTTARSLQLLVTVPGEGSVETHAQLQTVKTKAFVSAGETTVSLAAPTENKVTLTSDQGGVVALIIPYVLNNDTFWQQPLKDGLRTYTGACEKETGYRKIVSTSDMPILSYVQDCYQGIFTQLQYDPSSMYLWLADYTVQAGRQPRFEAFIGDDELVSEYFSRYKEYPDFKGFDQLQRANSWFAFSTNWYEKQVQEVLSTAPFYRAHTVIPPQAGAGEYATFEINQYSEDFSVLGLKQTAVVALPGEWINTEVWVGETEETFVQGQVAKYTKIWPSMWQVRVQKDSSSTEKEALLSFGQAYDKQWKLYSTQSWWKAFLGVAPQVGKQVKVNGWSNGWVISDEDVDETKTLTVFYVPDRLLLLGIILTILSCIFGPRIIISLQKREQQVVPFRLNKNFEPVRKFLMGEKKWYKRK